MRRARAHAQIYQTVLSGSLILDDTETNALPTLTGARRILSNSSKLAPMINEHTELVTWVPKSKPCDHHHHTTCDFNANGTDSECIFSPDESAYGLQGTDRRLTDDGRTVYR